MSPNDYRPFDLAIDLISSHETRGFCLVAQSTSGDYMGFEMGREELSYQDICELAAYHLLSVESEVDAQADEVLKDIIKTRNKLKSERRVGSPTRTVDTLKRDNQFLDI